MPTTPSRSTVIAPSMGRSADTVHHEVIDLTSDGDPEADVSGLQAGRGINFDDDNLATGPSIDLTGEGSTHMEGFLDVDAPPDAVEDVLTEAKCLQMILNVLPDISVNHVLALVKKNNARTTAECERLLMQILDDDTYPKESEANPRKRRRSEVSNDDITEFAKGQQGENVQDYRQNASNLLKDHFLDVPVKHIENTLHQHKTLFATFLVLETQVRRYNRISTSFQKMCRPRRRGGAEEILAAAGNRLPKELQAAKKKAQQEAEKRRQAEDEKRAEEDNVLQAQRNGAIQECMCCFDEFPLNRMVNCDGSTIHFFCKTCAKRYVEEEMGNLRSRPICFADSSCGGTFTRTQLMGFLGHRSFERLQHLQQQEDIRAAGLDFLAECPFCDFKAECPPVEIDKEFRCQNPKCGKTSCRLCSKTTHIPKSCEEAKKDETLSVRHAVEEAKSEALIRHCNVCKNAFIKEYGCNKMTCTKCGNMQCYACSENIKNYNHFGRGRCPLHDNQEARHENEVQRAEAAALEKIRTERPDISEEELKIEMSDRVKRAERARLAQAQVQHPGLPPRPAAALHIRRRPAPDQINRPAPLFERPPALPHVPLFIPQFHPVAPQAFDGEAPLLPLAIYPEWDAAAPVARAQGHQAEEQAAWRQVAQREAAWRHAQPPMQEMEPQEAIIPGFRGAVNPPNAVDLQRQALEPELRDFRHLGPGWNLWDPGFLHYPDLRRHG